jgi:UDP-GlcNAc:undecaprenyl-phosphate/decaprenyl-phosphate GlcNAc-1-phosphate transferase
MFMQDEFTMAPSWLVPFLLSALVTALMIRLMLPVAHRVGLVDRPGGRKHHSDATPSIGGLAMVAGVLVTAAWHASSPAFMAFLAAGLLLLVVGVIDDAIDVPWPWRILAQTIAALIMIYWGGVRVDYVGQVFTSTPLELGPWAVPFTVLGTIGVINAINMFDGVDGLAGSLCLAALAMLTMAAWYSGNVSLVQYVLPILAVVAVFLVFNMRLPWQRRARVFMGNAGSAFLGLTMAWVAFSLTQNAAHPVSPVLAPWLFAAPLIDCIVLTIRRMKLGRSPFRADRDHMHHLLLEAGFSPSQIALGLTGISCVMGLLAALVLRTNAGTEMHLMMGFLGLVVAYYWLTARRVRAVTAFRRLHERLIGTSRRKAGDAGQGSIAIVRAAVSTPVASVRAASGPVDEQDNQRPAPGASAACRKSTAATRAHRLRDQGSGHARPGRQPARLRRTQERADDATCAVAKTSQFGAAQASSAASD